MIVVLAKDVVIINQTFSISLSKRIGDSKFESLRLETNEHCISYPIFSDFPQDKVWDLKGLCLLEVSKHIKNSDSRYMVIDFDKIYNSVYNKLKESA